MGSINNKPHKLLFLLLFMIIITLIFEAKLIQGVEREGRPQRVEQNWRMRNSIRRLMIGSTAPICTYNECRGCKYKCRAEQVPVEGNDPINSPYHYRCVCHRSS